MLLLKKTILDQLVYGIQKKSDGSHFKASFPDTCLHTHWYIPFGTCVASLSPAALLAVITRFVEVMLDRMQLRCPVLQTGALGVTLSSYRVYVVANTDGLHDTVALT